MTIRRARVLLVAYACRPGESSEREVGWRWANLIQKNHNVTVLTRESHRPYIEAALADARVDEPAPEFIYFDLPGWVAWFKRGERGLYLYYGLWSLCAARRMRRMNVDGRWQITHFLTFGTLLWPQFSYRINTPFYVLGPVGGGERIPLSLRKSFGVSGQTKMVVRWFVQKAMFLNPIYSMSVKRADKIFVRTRETLDMIPTCHRGKTELLLETAISPGMLRDDRPTSNNDRLEIVSVGRLITSKFNPLMLEALAAFKTAWGKPFHVTIIGDGPERARLEELRDKLGLREVEFLGKKSPVDVFAALRRSDIYFSTTMKEGGTWAFFEAIASNVPIVCLKVNGPDMIVGDGCGIKVVPENYEQTRAALVVGLLALASDSELRASYATKARLHVQENYTWDRAAERVDAAYAELLSRGETGA